MSTELATFLFGTYRSRILALFYGQPEREFYLREVVDVLKASPGLVGRELGSLTHYELLLRRSHGHHVYFRANRQHPVFAELSGLLAKTDGIFAQLSRALAPLRERIQFAFVFGSFAKQEARASSDVDVAILGDVALDEVLAAVEALEKELQREIAPVIFTVQEFRDKLGSGNHFATALLRGEKVMLAGEQDELRRLGELRLDPAGTSVKG